VNAAPTLSATLAASPSSGVIPPNITSTITPTVSGTVTGTITYSSPSCGSGGTYNNNLNSTTGAFTCTYAAAGSYSPNLTVTRGGLTTVAMTTIGFNVSSTLTASMTASPNSGTVPLTTNLSTTVGGTATGVITYSNPGCSTGGTYNNDLNSSTGTFTCTYSSAGTYAPVITVSRGGINVNATGAVTATAPVSTLKICRVSCDSGGLVSSSTNETMIVGDPARNYVACFNTSATCNMSTGQVAADWTKPSDPNGAVILTSGNPAQIGAVTDGTAGISVTYGAQPAIPFNVAVSAPATVSCYKCNQSTGVCSSVQRVACNFDESTTNCSSTCKRDTNWREVAR